LKFWRVKRKLSKEERKELAGKITSLDEAILKKTEGGADIMAILNACKPFVNRVGAKDYASTPRIKKALQKLLKFGFLETR